MELKNFQDKFDEDVRHRGKEYFDDGRVQVAKMIPCVQAIFVVRGSSIYIVSLELKATENQISWSCTCSHFNDGFNCKHIWASLILADQAGFYRDPIKKTDSRSSQVSRTDNKSIILAERGTSNFFGLQESSRKIKNREVIFSLDLKASIEYERWYIKFLSRYHYQDGTVSDYCAEEISLGDLKQFKSSADKEIIKTIFKLSEEYAYYSSHRKSSLGLDSDVEIPALKLMSRHKKFYCRKAKEFRTIGFENKSERKPLKLRMKIKRSGRQYEVGGVLFCDREEVRIDKTVVHINPYTLIGDRFFYSDLDSLENWLASFQKKSKFALKSFEVPGFLSSLYAQEKIPDIIVPKEFKYKTIKGMSKVRLIIDKDSGSDSLWAELEFKYGEYYVGNDDRSYRVLDHDEKIIYERDLTRERVLRQDLFTMLGRVRPNSEGLLLFKESSLLELIGKAFNLNWEIVAFKKAVSQSRDYKIKATSGIDWFDLSMEMKFGNGQTITLPDLLKNLRSGKKMVTLADGTLGILNEEVIKKFSHLGLGAKVVNDSVRLSKAQALYYSSSLADDKNFRPDRKFQTLKRIFEVSKSPISSEPDQKFHGKLRSYQKKGLGWLETLTSSEVGCLLADDMGLGKTVCIMALLSKKLKGQALIVVPKSLVHNWKDEAAKFVPHLTVHSHFGGQRHDLKSNFSQAQIIITTYHTLRNDIDFFSKKHFEYLIVDEAQFVKNTESDIHRSARLIQADKKIALTGTPIENSMGDLFSILNIITPGLITKEGWEKHANAEDAVVLKHIHSAIRPFFLRRKKEDVLKDLPKKTEQTIFCELSSGEKRDYDHLKKYLWADLKGKIDQQGMSKVGSHVLVALLRLRQAACHQGLLKKTKAKKPSAKFEMLLEYLETILSEGHKVLIFSSFVGVLTLLKPHLTKLKIKYEYMDGTTSNRRMIVKRFQEDEATKVFLITLKTGGVGLNLTAANYVFILDPWWNPAAESQAIDRTHRIGQKNKVTAYKLISKDTVEEKVLALQAKKKAIANAIMETGGGLKGITETELKLLFS